MIHCDLCGGADAKILYRDMRDTALASAGVFSIAQCAACGLVYLHPRPAAEHLGGHYPAGYVPYQKSNPLIMRLKQRQWMRMETRLLRALGRRGSVLEIGCARGEMLGFLASRGWRAAGLEMDEASATTARAAGLDVRTGSFGSASSAPPRDERYDCIILSYVLEHLRSPRAALASVNDMLAEGGIAVVSVPHFNSWDRKIFGRYWHGFDVPRHFFFFTGETMRAYAARAGLVVRGIRYGYVPNDWIGGISRFLRARGLHRTAKFFTYKNPVLAVLFLPLAAAAGLAHRSSRFTFILQKLDA